MSVFTIVLIVFSILSALSSFVVIISAMHSSRIGQSLESEEKLRRIADSPVPRKIHTETKRNELFDIEIDAKMA